MPAWDDRALVQTLEEIGRREEEALSMFRAMPSQVDFFTSRAKTRLMRGGNQSGKSTCCAVDFAADALKKPIYGPDGRPLNRLMPPKRPMLMWMIGLGEDHIGDTLYRLLFESDLFDCIRDLETGRLRAFRGGDPADEARREQIEPSPPLIPERYIENIAWVNKGSHVVDRVTLTNGTVLIAYSSKADVKQGDPVDRIWIDEDIKYPKYVAEWEARCVKRKGRITWSSWPRTANPALRNMSKRAEEQRDREKPDVQEWVLIFSDNPFIDPDEKRKCLEGWASAGSAELRARDRGEFVIDEILMYPNYSDTVHCTPPPAIELYDEIDRLLESNGYEPPNNWTRYLWLDLGHSYTAGLFIATPPPFLGNYRIGYQELYLRHHDADACAEVVQQKTAGRWFQAFGIDDRFARQSITGMGKTFRQLYSEAFQRRGLKSLTTGSDFIAGSDNVAAGILAVRGWLTIQPNGRPILRTVKRNLPNFHDEIGGYSKKIEKDEAQELPAKGQRDHLMDDLRYAAAHGCPYVEPPSTLMLQPPGPAFEAFKRIWQRESPDLASATFYCGPGVAGPS